MWLIITLVVVLITSLYFWFKYNKGGLSTVTKLCSELSAKEREEIWMLFQEFFVKEFDDLQDFEQFLTKKKTNEKRNKDNVMKTYALLFRSKSDDNLKGFILVTIRDDVVVNNLPLTIIIGDYFALSRDYRSHSTPLLSLLWFCLKYKMSYTFSKNKEEQNRLLYYFFITYSFKSYLSFGRAIGEYWPCHSKQTPELEKKILDFLGNESSKVPYDWGVYDPSRCVIRDKYRGKKGSLKLSAASQEVASYMSNSNSMEFVLDETVGDCEIVSNKDSMSTSSSYHGDNDMSSGFRGTLKSFSSTIPGTTTTTTATATPTSNSSAKATGSPSSKGSPSLKGIPYTENLAKTLAFFLEQNPDFKRGDHLCVLTSISYINFLRGFKKAFVRLFGALKGGKGQRGGRNGLQASPSAGNSAPKNVAFGFGIRKEDKMEAEQVVAYEIRDFKVNVSEDELFDLTKKLQATKWPDQLTNTEWQYGTEMDYLKSLTDYWMKKFDWKTQEKMLNKFPHFKTIIPHGRNLLDVHFIHVRSQVENAFPLVLIHGWPGSVYDFYKVIEPLTDPESFGLPKENAFHVIVPSIPGYGWSSAPSKSGFDVKACAVVFAALMKRLNYRFYGAQGGDWGALISSYMALVDPEHCVGIHLNMLLADTETESTFEKARMFIEYSARNLLFTSDEVSAMESYENMDDELAYAMMHTTKPQTIGYSLSDSPVGLAAYLLEKYRSWSDCHGEVDLKGNGVSKSFFTKDELLTHIMIYWTTNTITSSMRFYYETKKNGRWKAPERKVEVPVGCAIFPKEMIRIPQKWASRVYNVQQWTKMPRGGHFPAQEVPNLLVEDVGSFFAKLRKNQRNVM